jgi:hypothetical protein
MELTMKIYTIETASQEFEVPASMLDKIINNFWFDGYQILNDDTNELSFEDKTGRSPTMVYRLKEQQ